MYTHVTFDRSVTLTLAAFDPDPYDPCRHADGLKGWAQVDSKIGGKNRHPSWRCFTKVAVSPLIMVRFWKFEIWHTRESGPDLAIVRNPSRARPRARWRHVRASSPRQRWPYFDDVSWILNHNLSHYATSSWQPTSWPATYYYFRVKHR